MGKLPDDPRFKHVDMFHTDLTKTFARVRKQMKEEQARRDAEDAAITVEQAVKIRVLKGATK